MCVERTQILAAHVRIKCQNLQEKRPYESYEKQKKTSCTKKKEAIGGIHIFLVNTGGKSLQVPESW